MCYDKNMKTIENTIESSETNHLSPFFPHPEEVLFFDIETTGFSPKSACVYLIGCAFCSQSGWKIRQYFAEDRSQEKQLLETFCSFASTFPLIVHFNGGTFDVPFLQERCKRHGIPPFSPGAQTDIYKRISPYKICSDCPDAVKNSWKNPSAFSGKIRLRADS